MLASLLTFFATETFFKSTVAVTNGTYFAPHLQGLQGPVKALI